MIMHLLSPAKIHQKNSFYLKTNLNFFDKTTFIVYIIKRNILR